METEPQKESSLDSQLSAGGCSSWSCPALKRTVREGEINLCSAQTRRSGAVCCGSIWWPLPTNTPWLSLGNFQALLCSEMGSGLLMLSVSRDDTPAFLLHLKLYPNREPPQGPLAWTLATLFPAQGLLPGCTRAATRISPHPPPRLGFTCLPPEDLSQGPDPSLVSRSRVHLRLHLGLPSGLACSPYTGGSWTAGRVWPGRACSLTCICAPISL